MWLKRRGAVVYGSHRIAPNTRKPLSIDQKVVAIGYRSRLTLNAIISFHETECGGVRRTVRLDALARLMMVPLSTSLWEKQMGNTRCNTVLGCLTMVHRIPSSIFPDCLQVEVASPLCATNAPAFSLISRTQWNRTPAAYWTIQTAPSLSLAAVFVIGVSL